jgi:hypothetical protein
LIIFDQAKNIYILEESQDPNAGIAKTILNLQVGLKKGRKAVVVVFKDNS